MTNDNKQPGYILKKHIVKFLTFWIFPEILRKYAARRLRWRLGIGAQPETLAEHLNYQRHIKQARKEAATKNIFAYRIVSLGSDCFSRTIPTLWGVKPRKRQGEPGCPFDLSTNFLSGIVRNIEEDFANYFNTLHFNGRFWEIARSNTVFSHENDCGPNDENTIRKRFSGRIDNFRRALADVRPALFVHHFIRGLNDATPDETAKLLNRLWQLLNDKRCGLPFRLLVVDHCNYIPAAELIPQICLFAPDYLPDDYLWNYPEFEFSAAGLRFETEFIEISQKLINQMKTDKKSVPEPAVSAD